MITWTGYTIYLFICRHSHASMGFFLVFFFIKWMVVGYRDAFLLQFSHILKQVKSQIHSKHIYVAVEKIIPWSKSWEMASEVDWVEMHVSSCLGVKTMSVWVEQPSVNVLDCVVNIWCVGVCVCTCIRVLSTSQHKWRVDYTDSFCRSRMSTQGRGLACWPGKPHLVAGCPLACSDHWGVCPSCSLWAEIQKRCQWNKKCTVNYSHLHRR